MFVNVIPPWALPRIVFGFTPAGSPIVLDEAPAAMFTPLPEFAIEPELVAFAPMRFRSSTAPVVPLPVSSTPCEALPPIRFPVPVVLLPIIFAGKRVRLSGWFKADSLQGTAYLEVFAHTPGGAKRSPIYEMLGNTFDWTRLEIEYDVPADAVTVWPWLHVPAPFRGTVWLDDAEFEAIGPAKSAAAPAAPAAGTRKRK